MHIDTPKRKIYVACPANVATGGPEALHQLCYNLRIEAHENAFMFYYNMHKPDPIHEFYKPYNNPFSKQIEDHPHNIIIVPEVEDGLNILGSHHKIKKIVWFLSIDNYYLFKPIKRYDFFFEKALKKSLRFFGVKTLFNLTFEKISKKYPMKKDERIITSDLLLTQSYRGMKHIFEETKKSPKYLSDYLNDDYLKESSKSKKDIILYNPSKGLIFTKKLIEYSPDLKFIPIKNMNRGEVKDLLSESKVYIDFGNHPGMDRLPREAAILGCCIITGKKGSAAFFQDIPIKNEYKFDDRETQIPLITKKIKECITDYNTKIEDFNEYRQKIMNQKNNFINDLLNIFSTFK
jgi:hypothetical protein